MSAIVRSDATRARSPEPPAAEITVSEAVAGDGSASTSSSSGASDDDSQVANSDLERPAARLVRAGAMDGHGCATGLRASHKVHKKLTRQSRCLRRPCLSEHQVRSVQAHCASQTAHRQRRSSSKNGDMVPGSPMGWTLARLRYARPDEDNARPQ